MLNKLFVIEIRTVFKRKYECFKELSQFVNFGLINVKKWIQTIKIEHVKENTLKFKGKGQIWSLELLSGVVT